MAIPIDQLDEREFRRAVLARARNGDREAQRVLLEEFGVTLGSVQVIQEHLRSSCDSES